MEVLGLHELNIPVQVINNISYAEKHSNKVRNNIMLAWKYPT
jgi:cellobiose-specific phosphotransferase system component IIB